MFRDNVRQNRQTDKHRWNNTLLDYRRRW